MAVELGQIKVESHLNQPLKAVIPLNGIDFDGLQDIKVSIADNQSYQTIGLSRPANLPRLSFELISGNDTSHLVQITSRQAIKDPILEILVQLLEKQGKMLRLYTLLIDPAGIAEIPTQIAVEAASIEPIEQPEMEVTGIEPIARQPETEVAGIEPIAQQPEVETVSTKPVVAAVRSAEQSQSDEKTIRVSDNSISIIAQNSALHERYSVYPIMRAFYLLNPHAFTNGNIEKLQAGSLLTIPPVEEVAAVTRQQAFEFVSSVSKDQTGAQSDAVVRAKNLEPTVVGVSTTDPGKNSQASSEIPPLVQSIPLVPGVVSVSEAMTAETRVNSSVGTLVERQLATDKGIGKLSGDESIKVAQLGSSSAQVSNPSGEVTKQIGEVRNTLKNQQKVIDIQGSRIDTFTDLLVRKSIEIADLNQRVESIEDELQMLPVQTLTAAKNNSNAVAPTVIDNLEPAVIDTLEPAVVDTLEPALIDNVEPLVIDNIEPPVIAVTSEPANESGNWWSSADFWMAIIATCLILLVAAFVWQGLRVRRQVQIESDEQVSRYASSSYRTDDDIGVSYVEKKTRPAEVEDQDQDDTTLTRAAGKGPIGLSSSGSSSKKLKIGKLADVYSEIDVYNGYELFDEAQHLLNAARRKYADDPGLDLKQLEILARAKNFERFIYLYEEKQDVLAQHFPLEWPKITRLRDSLKSEIQEDIAH